MSNEHHTIIHSSLVTSYELSISCDIRRVTCECSRYHIGSIMMYYRWRLSCRCFISYYNYCRYCCFLKPVLKAIYFGILHPYFIKNQYLVASVQQGRIIVTTLLQTWISLSATRSYHSYDLVADMDFAQCNKVVS